jgi:hypothetical protein
MASAKDKKKAPEKATIKPAAKKAQPKTPAAPAKKPEGISYWNKASEDAESVNPGHDDSVETTPHKTTPPPEQRLCLAITGRLNRKDSEQRQVYVPNTFLSRLMAVTSGPIQNVLLVLAERELTRLEQSEELVRVDMELWDGGRATDRYQK